MAIKLIKFMLSYVGIMAAGPALALIAVFVLKVDVDSLIAQHSLAVSLSFALYMFFVCYMFFHLQDVFIVFQPEAGSVPVSKNDLINRLEKAFNTPVDNKKLFDFMKSEKRVVITWSSSIDYFQLTSGGERGMKRVIVLNFDESSKDVYFVMQDKDWKWNLSAGFFDFSMNYATGIFAEFVKEAYPSISFSADGGLEVDMKRLSYNSNDLWLPIQNAVLSAGWTLRGGMLPNRIHRTIFSLPLAIIVFLLLYLILGGAAKTTDVITGETKETASVNQSKPYDYDKQLKKDVPYISTENLRIQLDGIMKTPRKHHRPETRPAFIAFANGYFTRKDRNDDFARDIRKYAEENGIEGLDPEKK